MNNTLKAVTALLFFFSSVVLASGDNTDWEQYFYEEKQKSYEKILSKLPAEALSESSQQDNKVYSLPYMHAEVHIKLKEQLIDKSLRESGGFSIEEDSPEKFNDILKKLTNVMFDLPSNSYIDFTFRKATMVIEVNLTKQGIDYLNSRDDIYFQLPVVNRMVEEDNGITEIPYIKK